MRTFAYCRVSRSDLTVENQIEAIGKAGYDIPAHRVIAETVSGSVQAMQRTEFRNMVENKLEAGDTLVVLKLDRLGRDNIDVQQTVNMLLEKGIRPVVLDLPAPDLSTSSGKLILQMFAVFAEFERTRIIERTQDGLARAKASGTKLGRPVATKTQGAVQEAKSRGLSQSKASKELGVSLATVKRHWNIED